VRILLLGGTGQVGEELRASALPEGVEIYAPARKELDLSDRSAIARVVAAERWSAVINAAAYTEVDRAESEEELAFAINAQAPGELSAETARCGIPLIHISTDYVFDGRKGAPYVEQDETAPVNAYGRSKLKGEVGVRAANPRHVILRTSWLYSPYRKNFVKTILRLAAERERLTIVADQRGCPTAAEDIAKACLCVGLACASEPERAPYGTYHFAGAGEASWFEFASVIVDMASGRTGRTPQVAPIRTIDYPTPARRAADTRLDCTAATRAFGVSAPPWRQSLEHTVDRLLSNRGFS
jgi:dTDP-4-dehydrorhamnose reductase